QLPRTILLCSRNDMSPTIRLSSRAGARDLLFCERRLLRGPSAVVGMANRACRRGLRVMQRAAAKRRETGPENRAGVDQIGIDDDVIGKSGLCFRDIRADEPFGEPRGNRCGRLLVRLAVGPRVKAIGDRKSTRLNS